MILSRFTLHILIALLSRAAATHAQTPLGTAFTYQGVLKSGGAPYSGAADLRFTLFDAPAAGNQIGAMLEYPAWSVVDGQFTTLLDFGALAFNGDERWLQIEVRAPAGSGSYMPLSPRQRMTAAPYALRALNASISGVQPAALTFSNANNGYTGASMNIDAGTLQVDGVNHIVGIGGTSTLARLNIATANRPVGVWIENTSNSANTDTGVFASAMDYGGFFQSTSNGGDAIGMYGLASNTGGINYGVVGRSMSPGGYAGYFDGAQTYVSQRLGVGTQTPTHQLTVHASDAETMRLFGSLGGFGHGARLNFGDGDYAYIEEDQDDRLHLWASRLALNGGPVGVGVLNPDPGAALHVSAPAGDGSVLLPGDAIADSEILDEPGISSAVRLDETDGPLNLVEDVLTTVESAQIIAPAPGFILVMADADVHMWGVTGGENSAVEFAISNSAGALPMEKARLHHRGGFADDPRRPMNLHRVFSVGAGTHAYYLLAQQDYGPAVRIYDARLTLVYVPSAYGSVETTSPPSLARQSNAAAPQSPAVPSERSEIEALRSELAELRKQIQAMQDVRGDKR